MNKARSNILLITTDTQRCDTLKCMGNDNAISPNIDRLASEGILFTDGYTSSPVCMPARCSLLTGVHTPIHQCIENGIKRREDLDVFTDYLREQGYINIMVGKTHFGQIPDSFDVKYILGGEKHKDVDDFYAEHISKHGYSRVSSHPNQIPEDIFVDAYVVDKTIESIEKVRSEGDNPFFAFCSLLSPHAPIDPPGKWAALYKNVPLPEINYKKGEVETQPMQLKRLLGTLYENDKKKIEDIDIKLIEQTRRLYYSLAAYCDYQIGRLIDYLDKSNLRENTLIIFTSDHGQTYFDHGFNDKHNFYDSSWRVPFIMSMPGTIPMGQKRDFAIWNDIPATILAAAGTKCDYFQGFDLLGPLSKDEESPRRCAVGTLYKSIALVTKNWKLEYYLEEAEGRLYDRHKDPKEQVNLFDSKEFEEIKNVLLIGILSWRSDIADIKFLAENTTKGGPVAQRIAPHTKAMKGTDAELRLNKVALAVDGR